MASASDTPSQHHTQVSQSDVSDHESRVPRYNDNFCSITPDFQRRVPPTDHEWQFLTAQSGIANASLPDPACIGCSLLDSGKIHPQSIRFECGSGPPIGWSDWCAEMLKDGLYRRTLCRSGVLHAIEISRNLHVKVDPGLRDLLIRWCTSTHTFIMTWGEMSPTLANVVFLLRLPLTGQRNPLEIELDESGKRAKAFLEEIYHSNCPKPTFAKWIKHFWGCKPNADAQLEHGKGSKSGYQLEALVALWLSRFIFQGSPKDQVFPHLFPMAIMIAQGVRYPLAPLFLGTLYRNLDLLHEGLKASGGTVQRTFINVQFLQMWAWEHIPGYASLESPENLDSSFLPLPRAWRWYRMEASRVSLVSLIDVEHNICHQPSEPLETFSYIKEEEHLARDCKDTLLPESTLLAICAAPGFLVSFSKKEVIVEAYMSDRFARQFGYDQGVPLPRKTTPFRSEVITHYLGEFTAALLEKLHSPPPRSVREAFVTAKAHDCWITFLSALGEFVEHGLKSSKSPATDCDKDVFLSSTDTFSPTSIPNVQQEIFGNFGDFLGCAGHTDFPLQQSNKKLRVSNTSIDSSTLIPMPTNIGGDYGFPMLPAAKRNSAIYSVDRGGASLSVGDSYHSIRPSNSRDLCLPVSSSQPSSGGACNAGFIGHSNNGVFPFQREAISLLSPDESVLEFSFYKSICARYGDPTANVCVKGKSRLTGCLLDICKVVHDMRTTPLQALSIEKLSEWEDCVVDGERAHFSIEWLRVHLEKLKRWLSNLDLGQKLHDSRRLMEVKVEQATIALDNARGELQKIVQEIEQFNRQTDFPRVDGSSTCGSGLL